jgi:hypothetical protein
VSFQIVALPFKVWLSGSNISSETVMLVVLLTTAGIGLVLGCRVALGTSFHDAATGLHILLLLSLSVSKKIMLKPQF